MKTRISPTLVGVFVLGALIIAIIGIMSFGGVNLFSRPQRFVVYFDESINGLDLGSPVKLRGVRVGRVVDMNVRYDETTNQSHVAVVCEFNRNILVDAQGVAYDVRDRKRLQSLVDHGLSAELDMLGLATGMLYVELGFTPPSADSGNANLPIGPTAQSAAPRNASQTANQEIGAPNSPAATPANIIPTERQLPIENRESKIENPYVVIPTKPSAISALQTNITNILGELKNMNLPNLARDADALLKDARTQLNTLDLAAMTASLTRAGDSITALAASPEARQTLADLDATINQLRATLARLDTTLAPANDKLAATLADAQATLKKFSATADSAKRLIDAQTGLGETAARALKQLNEAAASVQRLADYLERNPNALLTGKKQP